MEKEKIVEDEKKISEESYKFNSSSKSKLSVSSESYTPSESLESQSIHFKIQLNGEILAENSKKI